MKTALQILKEKINYRILNEFRRDNDYTRGYECALESVIDEIEQLLPTEQEQTEALKKEIEELRKEVDKFRSSSDRWYSKSKELANLHIQRDIKDCIREGRDPKEVYCQNKDNCQPSQCCCKYF